MILCIKTHAADNLNSMKFTNATNVAEKICLRLSCEKFDMEIIFTYIAPRGYTNKILIKGGQVWMVFFNK